MNLVVKLWERFWFNQLKLLKIPVAEPNYCSINMVKIPSICRKFPPAPLLLCSPSALTQNETALHSRPASRRSKYFFVLLDRRFTPIRRVGFGTCLHPSFRYRSNQQPKSLPCRPIKRCHYCTTPARRGLQESETLIYKPKVLGLFFLFTYHRSTAPPFHLPPTTSVSTSVSRFKSVANFIITTSTGEPLTIGIFPK